MPNRLFVFGAGPAGVNVLRGWLEANPNGSAHVVANWLPDGTHIKGAKEPTYLYAAGIQQPFGGSNPDDPRLRMYERSHPKMMAAARSPEIGAVQLVELRTLVEQNSPLPSWRGVVEGYSRSGNLETYTTASFDPAGLVLYWWEEVLQHFGGRISVECRNLSDGELSAIQHQQPPQGFDKVVMCAGYEGSKLVFGKKAFPILGVGVHFEGTDESTCWMDESRPAGTSGQPDEPDCFYAISRPRYLGQGKRAERGQIFLGGTIKPNIEKLSDGHLDTVARAIVEGCNIRFGTNFIFGKHLKVTQCRRPGFTDGFRLYVSPDKRYGELIGQAGMGIVTASGSGDEMARLLCE